MLGADARDAFYRGMIVISIEIQQAEEEKLLGG